ncbi:MAG TPA: SDR family oxidoreductase [Jatrophihabitans sp.]|jgi:NAD(P)-dependent dehydrogenase (short-subunit alcohol dehydrogenase family)
MTATTASALTGELSGLTALVTGATSGIGRAAALKLAEHGATMLVHGRDRSRGADVVDQIERDGGQARFVPADLSDPADITHLASEVGHVDILVNNAGSSWFGPSSELDAHAYDRLFDSNVRSAYLLTAALAPTMAVNGGGVIINVSSMVATIGMPEAAAYSATKAALAAMTRSWAAEYGANGVRVNAVAPGPVYTEGAKATDAIAKTTLLNRGAQPEEIAETIAFLASPRAAYITGATVAVDGGRTAV